MELEDLPGVGSAIAGKLKEAGFSNLMRIATATASELVDSTGIGLNTAARIIQSAREAVKLDYELASEVYERRMGAKRLTTGSSSLDKLLGGGLETGAVTELFGEFGSGKSQLAHQLSVNVQLPEERGGLEGGAIFIDTENTFRPERIRQMAEALGLDPERVLQGIHVARAYTTDHQMLLAERAGRLAEKHGIRLVVVDSVTALFRSEYCGRGTLAERQQKLGRHMAELHRVAEVYGVAVLVTNQVQARPDVLFGDPTKPIGGHVLGHAVTARVYLRKAKENLRVAKLVDHPCLPPETVTFRITEAGVRD
jgi:DNA repair protein RadA